ncbi:MAG: DedA family protein [Longimicrobiales bacterium]|nr:DedA family protein [Longimicrobiales bacterium]
MDLVPLLFDQLATHGPWLLFVMAILETCFVTGLVVPSGVATSVGTIIALEGGPPLATVVVAAAAGGFVGDSIGYWIGRRSGEHVLREGGRWRRLLGSRLDAAEELFGKHPVYSVTVARLISFVRTVMPMAAGMSGISYRRYLPYELVGLLGWVAIYVSIGFGGREGWEAASRIFGVGGAVAFLVVAAIAFVVVRRRGRVALVGDSTDASAADGEAG